MANMKAPTVRRGFHRHWKLFALACCFGLVLLALSLPPGADEGLGFLVQRTFGQRSPLQSVRGCNCTRPYLWPTSSPRNSSLNSTFHRPLQKVISFSLRLSPHDPQKKARLHRLYAEGLELNLKAARELYPNFTLRIYTDHQLSPEDSFCPLLCLNSHVFWCDARVTGHGANVSWVYNTFFMTWRFLPLGDPTVDVFLSRDLDSVISSREAAAVWDWLEGQKGDNSLLGIHVMRDNAVHVGIMGGMWGARNLWVRDAQQLHNTIFLTPLSAEDEQNMFPGSGGEIVNDQRVLAVLIYHPRKEEILVHASYHCDNEPKSQTRPFPIRRRGPVSGRRGFTDFVGNTGLGRDVYQFHPCPKECRPTYGKNWTFC